MKIADLCVTCTFQCDCIQRTCRGLVAASRRTVRCFCEKKKCISSKISCVVVCSCSRLRFGSGGTFQSFVVILCLSFFYTRRSRTNMYFQKNTVKIGKLIRYMPVCCGTFHIKNSCFIRVFVNCVERLVGFKARCRITNAVCL